MVKVCLCSLCLLVNVRLYSFSCLMRILKKNKDGEPMKGIDKCCMTTEPDCEGMFMFILFVVYQLKKREWINEGDS